MMGLLIVGVALSAFCAGFLIGRAERQARHTHSWEKWRREAIYAISGTSTRNIRECASCGLTEARPIE